MTYPQGANPGSTWRAPLTYLLRLPQDTAAQATVQLSEANIRVDTLQGDQLQLGGKTVTRARVTDAAGQTTVTYAWDAVGLSFTLSATLGPGIDESLLERFVRAMPGAAPSAWASQLYAFRDGDVAVIDSQTGDVTRTLGAQVGSQSPSLAIDAASGRIAVADFLRDTATPSFGVMLYRMSDGSLEREIPTGLLPQGFGPSANIALTAGGQYLIVRQYEIPPDGNGNNARYWLGVWDLNSGEHVRDIPVSGCPYVTRMVSPQPNHLYVLCTDYWQAFDPVGGKLLDTYGPNAGDAAFLIRDGQLYEVSPGWHAQVMPLDGSSGGREYTGLATNLPDLVAAPIAIGLDPTGQFLYVPAGAPDAPGPTAIVVIDLRSGRPSRVIQLGQPFREIAFAPDASAAFVTLTDTDGAVTGLARVDLALGRPTWQSNGAFYEVTAAAP
jgi:DNA-binding beta-propeller fold protein YncE